MEKKELLIKSFRNIAGKWSYQPPLQTKKPPNVHHAEPAVSAVSLPIRNFNYKKGIIVINISRFI